MRQAAADTDTSPCCLQEGAAAQEQSLRAAVSSYFDQSLSEPGGHPVPLAAPQLFGPKHWPPSCSESSLTCCDAGLSAGERQLPLKKVDRLLKPDCVALLAWASRNKPVCTAMQPCHAWAWPGWVACVACIAADLPDMERDTCPVRLNSWLLDLQGTHLTARAVTRILHGIASPAYPSDQWHKCGFWQRFTNLDFAEVMQMASTILKAPRS